jgi:endonuclease-3
MKVEKSKIKKINTLLINFYGIPKRQSPLPDPLDMLIATILSQNTNDQNSYKAYKNLRDIYTSWDEILSVSAQKLERQIKVAGLANQKAAAIKNVILTLSKKDADINLNFIKEMGEEDAIKYLTSMKGVGLKTASCVLLFALNKNVCPVDTHVHRTTNRIGIVKEKTPDKTFTILNKKITKNIAHSFHTNLIRLGREICKPRNPSCGICPLLKICEYDMKNLDRKDVGKKRDFMLLDNVDL